MFQWMVVIIVGIVIWKICISNTNRSRKNKFPIENEKQEVNKKMFISDVLATIDRVAPRFKYIAIDCRSALALSATDDLDFLSDWGRLTITNENDGTLIYDFKKHGFAPGIEARKSLAIEIAQKYGGNWIEEKKDVSHDSRPCWSVVCYWVIAHDGISEMETQRRKKESIRKC